MALPLCVVCRAIPASTFCSIHLAFLCPPCDTAIHLPDRPSCPDHHRVSLPLYSLPILTPTSSTPLSPPLYNQHSPDKTSSTDTALDDSDQSSHLPAFSDDQHFPTFPISNHFPSPPSQSASPPPPPPPLPTRQQQSHNPNAISLNHDVSTIPPHHPTRTQDNTPYQNLASIADAFIKKEAQHLYESSTAQTYHPHFPVTTPLTTFSATRLPSSSRHTAPKHSSPSKQSQHFHTQPTDVPNLDLGHDFFSIAATPTAASNSSFSALGGQSSTVTTDEQRNVPRRHALDAVKKDGGLAESFKLEKTEEQKRRDRHAALVRFRIKKANRSFRKKVRYECRKQLADSRPRVRGRFVGRPRTAEKGAIRKRSSTKG